MPMSVLVVTPHAAFGELIRISLEDNGPYKVKLVQSAKEARAQFGGASGRIAFHLAILDSALPDEPFIPLCMDLLAQQPGVRLLVIPPENNPNHPSLGGLIPHGYLSRPFYLPDLLDTVTRLLAERDQQIRRESTQVTSEPTPENTSEVPTPAAPLPRPATAFSATVPPWLQDTAILRDYLTSELAKTQARAGMIAVNTSGPDRALPSSIPLHAVTGSLGDTDARELASVVFRYWNGSEKTDLMRYIRLSTDKKDYLVYATPVTGELVLILVYDNTAPVSHIRPQTKSLAQSLASRPPENYLRRAEPPATETPTPETPAPETPADTSSVVPPTGSQSEAEAASETGLPAAEPARGAISYPLEETGVDDEDAGVDEDAGEESLINLSALLGSVPPPDPAKEALPGAGWSAEMFVAREIPTLTGRLEETGAGEQWKPRTSEPAPHAASPRENRPFYSTLPKTQPLDPNRLRELDAAQPEPAGPTAPVKTGDTPPEPEKPDMSLPVNYALPPEPGETRPMRRSAALDVKTEPPIMTPPPPITHSGGAQAYPLPEEPPESPPLALTVKNELTANLEPADEMLEDLDIESSRSSLVNAFTHLDQLESASPALSMLNYTCVLVPRLPQHYLTGDLADRLAQWVQQLCLAFGWRLEGIAIRPEYLQWTVQVAPAVSPGNLVRIIRQRLSAHIFNTFPHMADQNPSGDFWATGYLIVSGNQPPSAQLLRDYIAQTRKRQGIIK